MPYDGYEHVLDLEFRAHLFHRMSPASVYAACCTRSRSLRMTIAMRAW